MKERPLLIIVMAILHILEPLFKIFYFKTKTNFDLSIILSNVTTFETIGMKGLIDFWLIFPFAGIALLSVKKYAWYFFVLTQAYSIVTHLTYERFSWPYFSEVPFFLTVLLIVTNFFLIIYVSEPKIRMLFFEKNNRWWETNTRYKFIHPIKFWHTNPEKTEMATFKIFLKRGRS